MEINATGPGPDPSTGSPTSVGPPTAWTSALATFSESVEQLRYSIEAGGLADLDEAELIAMVRRYRRTRDRMEALSDRVRRLIPGV